MTTSYAVEHMLLSVGTAPPAAGWRAALARWVPRDPRYFQLATLGGLLIYGLARLDLDVKSATALLILATALATQTIASRLAGLARIDLHSAGISGLSLCLLLRTNSLAIAALAAMLAVGSKFVVRWRGKHIYNPTNFGIVAVILLTGGAWVSPAQWGNTAYFSLLLLCLGALVVNRAARSDITVAFIAAYVGLLFGRALWVGQPLAIPLHQLTSGALLIFAFFMISDPKSTPDTRLGRVLFATLVACGAAFIQFKLYRPNGPLLALAACAPLTPVIDTLFPGRRYRWDQPALSLPRSRRIAMRRTTVLLFTAALLGPALTAAHAFCGFYVAKADSKLFNQASQVVLVRDEDKTVLTMANDFKGEPKEFAIVIPVPTFVSRGQIHVAENALIDHLDAYSAPRLVEYFDADPCIPPQQPIAMAAPPSGMAVEKSLTRLKGRGVHIEATYTVGEYDIVILSAEQSDGLAAWLRENGYRVPDGAEQVLGTYLKQGVHFFLAKVNLKEQARLGFTHLRPLQIAFQSPRFMLPIRLGMVNASGSQEIFVYALTRKGRVETTNYRNVKLPSGDDVPLFVKDEFAKFYRSMFEHQVVKQDQRAVFLEYAWDMNWCDPCAAEPLSRDELQQLGVFWLPGAQDARAGAQDVFLTRLHIRYDGAHFPEDLAFQETADRENFQGSYVLRHPWTGAATCKAAVAYRHELQVRREHDARTLASLTGWEVNDIRRKMNLQAKITAEPSEPWWKAIWKP